MIDYSIFYKESFSLDILGNNFKYDLFISEYDDCERTKAIYERIQSSKKIWLAFPQYKNIKSFPTHGVYKSKDYAESDYFAAFIDCFKKTKWTSKKISIDITGIPKPHLAFIIKFLSLEHIPSIDLFYTEPQRYLYADETRFSGFIDKPKSIEGCTSEINNPSNPDEDLLIIAAGYDDNAISKISVYKEYCRKKYCILGFPSLQPDMYQENILKLESAKLSLGEYKKIFAPAYDPFITAQEIANVIANNPNVTNIYLSPLSTKPQTIGMVLFYLYNRTNLPVSLIFPYSNTYTSGHALGIKRVWKYTLEF
jgi:hypothetical protein